MIVVAVQNVNVYVNIFTSLFTVICVTQMSHLSPEGLQEQEITEKCNMSTIMMEQGGW